MIKPEVGMQYKYFCNIQVPVCLFVKGLNM